MEPILLSYKEAEANIAINSLKAATTKVQKFFDQLSEICDFKLTTDLIQDILGARGERTARLIETKVRQELEQAKITSQTVIKLAVNGDLEKFFTLLTEKPDILHEHFTKIEINQDQRIQIKPGVEDEIREHYRTYIRTEAGKALYDKHIQMVNAMKELIKLVPDISRIGIDAFIHYADKKTVLMTEVDYDRFSNKLY